MIESQLPQSQSKRTSWLEKISIVVFLLALLFCGLKLLGIFFPTNVVVFFWNTRVGAQTYCLGTIGLWIAFFLLVAATLKGTKNHVLPWLILPVLCIGVVSPVFSKWGSALATSRLNEQEVYLFLDSSWDTNYRTLRLCEQGNLFLEPDCHDFYSIYDPIIPIEYTLVSNEAANNLEVKMNGDTIYEYGC